MNPALQRFWEWRKRLDAGAPVVWDIETPGLDPSAGLLCLSWTNADGELQSHWGNMLEAGDFMRLLEPDQLLVAHNWKFEAQSLIARGFDVRQFVAWDTMMAEWVLLANNPHGLSLGLDESAQRYGCEPKDPVTDALIKAGRVLEVPQSKLLERNRKDVTDTATIFRRQLARMTEEQIRLTLVRSMMTTELAYMELEGMGLDPVRVAEESARNAAEVAEHELALRDITRGANPRSVNEMAPVLYGMWPAGTKEDAKDAIEPLGFTEPRERGKPVRLKPTKAWPDGRPSISRETMEGLAAKARTPRQKLWAKHYLALTDAISERDKNLTYYRGVCDTAGGVIYAELRQGITATHRLSCGSKLRVTVDGKEYGCQLQNTPRHLKGCFKAKRPDYLAASVDQSQAEFRGAVFLGDDEQGRADIANPMFDAHIQTLAVMLHGPGNFQANYDSLMVRYKSGDKEVSWQRADNKLCKSHTFKPLFGGMSGSDRERAYYKWFGQRYSGITATQDGWDEEVQLTGCYVAPTGMVFNWDRKWTQDWKGRSRMVNHHGRSLYSIVRNLPIQYFATGELAMASTLCLLYHARATGLRYFPVMLIHDDTSGEIHKDDVEAFHQACGLAYGIQTHEFLFSVYSIDYDVELAAESKVGIRFGSGDKQAHSYSSPFTDEEKFSMKVAAKTGGPRKPNIEEGTHIALVQAVVDLGIQPGSTKYPEPKRKVYVGFEFPGSIVEYKNEDNTVTKKPARAGRFLTLSMNEKASFRKLVEGLRGKKFASDTEATGFDVFGILGGPCMVPVSHKVVGENVYTNLGDPQPVLKGMVVEAKLSEAALAYDTDAHDEATFKALPEWLRDIVNAQIVRKASGSAPAAITGGLPDLGTGDADKPF